MSSAVTSLSATHQSLFSHKKQKKLTFEQIGQKIGRDEVWVAAVFYGQAKPEKKDLEGLSHVLSIPLKANAMGEDHYFPERGAVTPMPPTDPVLYRLYEAVLVYGYPIKQVIHEKFGDGIMSAINFNASVEKVEKDGADYVKLTFLGKFLPYTRW
ncbi:hypothetical protein JCM5353_001167 [Sporobolomyces roseus]